MIHFVYGKSLSRIPTLAQLMFHDRTEQRPERVGHSLTKSSCDTAIDEYDALNPLYVIVSDGHGHHLGSMRLMPTTGPTMTNEHPSHRLEGGVIVSPHIWECAKFCISEQAGHKISASLMAAGAKLMQETEVDHFVGIFDKQKYMSHRDIGKNPTIFETLGEGLKTLGIGVWAFSKDEYKTLLKAAEIDEVEMELFFVNSELGPFLIR